MSLFQAIAQTLGTIEGKKEAEATKQKESVLQEQSKAKVDFNLGQFVAEKTGGKVTAYDRYSGIAKIVKNDPETGKEVEGEFDAGSFIKTKLGKDINQWNPIVNDASTPIDENALDLKTSILMSSVSKPSDKYKILTEKFGKENISMAGDVISVKQDGVWKKAETGMLGELISALPETIAAGVVGTKATALGATIGFFSPIPGGTVIGGLVAGAVGAGLATLLAKGVKDKSLEAMGIKTEDDAQVATEEMTKAAISSAGWQLAFGTTGVLARAAWNGPGGKMLAGTFEKFTGTPADDWLTLFGRDGAAKQTLQALSADKAHVNRKIKEKGFIGLMPSEVRLAETAVKTINDLQVAASKNYEDAFTLLQNQGVLSKARGNISDVTQPLTTALQKMNLLDADGKWIGPAQALKNNLSQPVFDAKSQTMLKKIYSNAVNFGQDATASFDEIYTMRRTLDNILKSSNVFANPNALTSDAKEIVKTLRNGLRAKEVGVLGSRKVVVNGKIESAQNFYANNLSKYSNFTDNYEEIALPKDLSMPQAVKFVNKIFMDNNIEARGMQQAFENAAAVVGTDAGESIGKLRIAKAAANLSKFYVPGRKMIESSAAAVGRGTAKLQNGYGLQTIGKMVNHLTSLTPDQQISFISNPQLVKQFIEIPDAAEATAQGLKEQVLQGLGNGQQ